MAVLTRPSLEKTKVAANTPPPASLKHPAARGTSPRIAEPTDTRLGDSGKVAGVAIDGGGGLVGRCGGGGSALDAVPARRTG